MQAVNPHAATQLESEVMEVRSPTLTIAIPTYNRRDSVVALVQTLIPQLAAEDELLVLDDASTDGTATALQGIPRVKVLSNAANVGMVNNWNACLLAAARDWVCVIHDDDRIAPDALNTIRRACSIANQPALITHQSIETDLDQTLRYRFLEPGPWSILNASTNPSGVTLHRSIIDAVGLFGDQFAYSCDLEYFARICTQYPCIVVESPQILYYNQHDQNYQYKTWRQAAFWSQLEQIERTILRYAKLTGDMAEQRFRSRMSDYARHMLRHAKSADDSTLLRHVGSLLWQQNYLGRRVRLSALIAALLNIYVEF